MGVFIIKRFSTRSKLKSYTLKRKTFGFLEPVADVAKNTVNTGVNVAKNIGGTAMTTGGRIIEKTAQVAKPVAGLAGGTAGALGGAAAGAALGSFVPIVGTAIGAGLGAFLGAKGGSKLTKGAVDVVENAGNSIAEGGEDLKGA